LFHMFSFSAYAFPVALSFVFSWLLLFPGRKSHQKKSATI
jgi:hypothetical protein